MATTYIGADFDSGASTASVTVPVPAGVQEGDLLLASISRAVSTDSPTGEPSGWALISETTTATNSLRYSGLYFKVASSSEPTDYTWTFAAANRTRGDMTAWRGGYDTADPIDVSSLRQYSTNGTALPGNAITVTSDGSAVIFVGAVYSTSGTGLLTPPDGHTTVYDSGDTTSGLWSMWCSGEVDAGTTDVPVGIILFSSDSKNVFYLALNPAPAQVLDGGTFSLTGGSVGTTQYQQLTGGTFSLTGGAVETDYDTLTGGTFSLTGGSIINSRLYVPPSGTFSLTGGTVETTRYQQLIGGTFSLTGGSVVNSRLHVPPSGVFSFAGGSVATARLQVAGGGVFSFAGGSLPDSLQTTVALYRDVLDNAYAIYACNTFGNDTDGNYIWERLDSTKDLILGDGSTASTFPTFTTTADKHTEYYAFDGVDDYVGNWPTAGFVSAALSSSYPDGQPYVIQVTDDTVKDLLTVGGAFTGNLHSLVFFGSEPTEADKLKLADYQLRRLWRDTIIDPYTARLIRNGEAVQVYDFQVVQ